jgi:RHS repeat-associated protein
MCLLSREGWEKTQPSFRVSRGDSLNRLDTVKYPGGERIDYDYDEVGNQTTITTTFGTVTYNYDDSNRLSSLTLPNTQVVNYQYYPQGHISAGNLQRIDNPNGTVSTYTYDTRNRILNLYNGRPGGVISQYTYTLDGVGNRATISFEEPLTKTNPTGTVNSSYLLGNLLKSSGTTTYTYDGNGNLATKTQGSNVTNYTFDSQDRLTQVSSPSLNMQYQYDGLFNRVSKTVSGTTTKFLVDPNGFLPQVIAEMDNGGNIISYYVYDGTGLVAKITSGGSVYYYHYDGIGTTIAMTDSNANMVNKYAYDEFGNLLNFVEAVSNPFLYVGQYGVMDEDNGLLYMRARYYDPQVGRFISKDPIKYGGGINLYAYVENDPIDLIDPLGLDYWVEGAVEGEAGLGFHQSICVGKRNGARKCISFGRMPGQGDCYFKCKGHIYEDKSAPGDIYQNSYRVTSEETDIKIRKYFTSLLGTEGRWDVLLGKNCRSFSQDMFWHLLKTYGGTPRVSP